MTDNVTAINPYVIKRVNRWIHAPEDSDIAGLAIMVRQHITNAERDDLIDQTGDLVRYSAEFMSADLEQREELKAAHGGLSPRDVEWSLLAPYVIKWNVQAETDEVDENGEPIYAPVPPPSEAGTDVFKLIPNEHYTWIYEQVIRGYRALGKAGSWSGA